MYLIKNKIWYFTNRKNNHHKALGISKGLIIHRRKLVTKQLYRNLSWNITNISVCLAIQYDPYRRAFISLISSIPNYNRLYWLLAPAGMIKGALYCYLTKYLFNLLVLYNYFNISIYHTYLFIRQPLIYFKNKRLIHGILGAFVLAAGVSALIINILYFSFKVLILLPSTFLFRVSAFFYASSGIVSNNFHYLKSTKKASYLNYKGRRPIVNGISMNPIDHPHGGSTIGRPLVSPWGKYTCGYKTKK